MTFHVLLYSPYSLRYNGGGERWIVEVAKRVRRCRFEIVTTSYAGEREGVEPDSTFLDECARLTPLEIPARRYPPGFLITSPRILRVLEQKAAESDCILFNNVFPPQELLVLYLKLKLNLPVQSMYQAPIVSPTALTATYRNLVSFRVGRRFDTHHVLNKSDYLTLQSKGYKHVVLIPNGVDTSYFHPGSAAMPHRKFIVLFVGRLNRHKGFDILLEIAAKFVGNRKDEAEIWVAGSGPLSGQAWAMSRNLPQFRFLGQCTKSQLRECYMQATVAVFPSRWEGLPMVGIEAIASGLPLVASDIPGFHGICVNGTNGFIVDPTQGSQGFLSALREAFMMWKDHPERFEVFRKASRDIAIDRFDWSVVVPQIEAELVRLCDQIGKSTNDELGPVSIHT